MPRPPRFKVAAIEELYEQLRYTPAPALHRLMDAAERLAGEIEPTRNYPEDFIVFRITGYRPDLGPGGRTLVGEALLPDLGSFIHRLSRRLNLPPDHAGRQAVPLEEAARRWNVSIRTMQRYRAQGLVCHCVNVDGESRLACFEDSLERFARRTPQRLQRASVFTRLGSELEKRILDEAREMRRRRPLSLNEAARELARRHGRAHETVRQVLMRHDRGAASPGAEPIFTEHGPLAPREIRLIHRAWRFGVAARDLADRFARPPATIHRAINRRRAVLLQGLSITHVPLPTFHREDAADVILSHPAVTENLDARPPADDALALLEALPSQSAPAPGSGDDDADQAMLAAYNFLKARAQRGIARLPAWPSSAMLDRIETDLRWAGLLKRRLLALALPHALRAIEQHLHRSLQQQPAGELVGYVALAAEAVSSTIDRVDPARGRLARLCAYAADRALSAGEALKGAPSHSRRQSRAAARHRPGSVPMHDALAGLTPWEANLGSPGGRGDLREHLDRIEPSLAEMVRARYGWSGKPPQTVDALAGRLRINRSAASRMLSRAEAELRRLARRAARRGRPPGPPGAAPGACPA